MSEQYLRSASMPSQATPKPDSVAEVLNQAAEQLQNCWMLTHEIGTRVGVPIPPSVAEKAEVAPTNLLANAFALRSRLMGLREKLEALNAHL